MQGILERAIVGNPDLELSPSSQRAFGRADISFESRGDLFLIEVKGGKYDTNKFQSGVGQAFLYGLYRVKKAFLAIPREWLSKDIINNLVRFARGEKVPFCILLVSNPGVEIVGEVGSHINFG